MRSALLLTVLACFTAQAQWINSPTPRAPRTKDGKVDMKGKVPRNVPETDRSISDQELADLMDETFAGH